jgi:hypothetical protein
MATAAPMTTRAAHAATAMMTVVMVREEDRAALADGGPLGVAEPGAGARGLGLGLPAAPALATPDEEEEEAVAAAEPEDTSPEAASTSLPASAPLADAPITS